MASASPKIVAEWVEKSLATKDFLRLREALPTILRRYYKDKSDEQLADYAEELERPVADALLARASATRQDGFIVPFEVTVDGSDPYVRSTDRAEFAFLRKLKALSATEFEDFCRQIVSKIGGVAVVSGGPHDGGIDFFAHGLQVGCADLLKPPTSAAFLLGQAKRYTTNDVSEPEVRSFVGGAMLKANEVRLQYADRIGLNSPLQLAYWTTADFTESAKTYSRAMGIWFLGGVGLSQLAMRVGIVVSPATESKDSA